MSIIDNKKLLQHALNKIDGSIDIWDSRYLIYEYKEFELIENMWCVLLITSNEKYMVTDMILDNAVKEKLRLVKKTELIEKLKLFEDKNYKIYYKQLEQKLVGYLLDFFVYYVEMPDKIITDEEENIELYKRIKKQKFF